MGMKITALGVPMADGDAATKGNVGRNILHSLGIECCLEFRRHETIAVAGVDQTQKMDGKHAHIKGKRDDNETEKSREEMFKPQSLQSVSFKAEAMYLRTLTGVTFLVSPRRIQSWTRVKLPTQAMVKRPTHFTLKVAPRPTPVIASQNHQDGWNALDGPCSCWFVKLVQARAVMAVKRTSGESRRMRRDCVTRALSM